MRKALFTVGSIVFLLILHSSLCFAYEKEIGELSSTITHNISKSGKKTIAVVDFTDLQGNVTELGRFISEELSVDLSIAAKGFEVIDRNHLKSILEEHKLTISGLVNPNNLKKLGQIAGVDAIVTGSVTPFGDSIRVAAKVITTDAARVIGAGKSDIPKTKAIEELLARGIETNATPSAGSDTALPAPKPQAKTQQKATVNNFLLELQGCSLSARTVTCNLIVTNKGGDRNFNIADNGSTTIFDESGNRYECRKAYYGINTNYFLTGIPIRASFSCDGISSQIGRIELLHIAAWGAGDVEFRNISLSK